MDVKELVQQSFETVIKKPIYVEVDIKPKKPYNWFDRLLIKLKIKQTKVVYRINPPVVGTRKRIAPLAMNIPDDILKNGINSALWSTSVDNIIYIIASLIQNNKEEPEPSLIDFIEWNFDDTDIHDVLNAGLGMINIKAFTNSIILIKGAEILDLKKMSPIEPEELIAPGL